MTSAKEKREYAILAILVIGTLWVLYSHFFAPSSLTVALPSAGTPTLVGGSSSAILPNGPQIDLAPVQDPRFKNLVPPNYPVVSRGEVGTANPFR